MKESRDKISVIVCTLNRADILRHCLQSLTEQTSSPGEYEVLIINNNSIDNTEEIIRNFTKNYSHFRTITEENKGLSYARNRGVIEAKYDWIAFVDDDAIARPNFVEVALHTIQNYDFDCFGGFYNAWFRHGPPPSWLPKNFGTNRAWLPDILGELPPDKEFSGGVCAYRKQAVIEAGLFPTFLGMQGSKIGYGEENFIQRKIRELGYKIGFNPELQIDHEVREEKLTVKWHLLRSFATNRDQTILNRDKISLRNLISLAKRETWFLASRIIKNGKAFLGRKMSFNELLLKTLTPSLSLLGHIAGAIKSASLNKKN